VSGVQAESAGIRPHRIALVDTVRELTASTVQSQSGDSEECPLTDDN
jgi:hypothetical protein